MPNFTDAPWNAPVEDEGKELSDADIPTRRRKPGEKKEDVLTELIFGSYSDTKRVEEPRQPEPKRVPAVRIVSVPKVSLAKKASKSVINETDKDKRARLLKELEDLEKKEKEIASSLRTFERPEKKKTSTESPPNKLSELAPLLSSKKGGRKRVTSSSFKNARPSFSSPLAKVDGLQKEPTKNISAALPVSVPLRTPEKKINSVIEPSGMDAIIHSEIKKEIVEPKKEIVRPSTVVTVEKQVPPVTEPLIPMVHQPVPVTALHQSEETEQKIYEYYTKDHALPKKRNIAKQAILVSVAFLIVAGLLGFIDGKNLPTTFAFLSNISGFLRQSSFELTQANREAFPQLIGLYGAVEEARSQFSNSEELNEISDSLETFFDSNESFTWRGFFNGNGAELHNVSELGNVLKQKKLFEAAHEHVLLMDSQSLAETLTWYSFVGEFFRDSATYLILTTNTEHPTPTGGEPIFYAVVEISEGKAMVSKAGSTKDLNAALTSKIVPPLAVQGVKTDLDLLDAGWLSSFSDAAQLMTLMYEQTTQEKIDGVVVITEKSAASLMDAAGVSGGISQNWVADFFKSMGDSANIDVVSDKVVEEFNRGALQASFEQNTFSTFAHGRLNRIAEVDTMDSLWASLRVWEGDGAEVSLLEYNPHFYGDGSIVGNAKVEVKNFSSYSTLSYLKIYIPKQSMLLDAQGYSQKEEPAPFDYSKEGFAQHALIERLNERTSEEFVLLDLYDEGEFLVVGGWVLIPASSEKAVTLSYRIPSRLDWRAGNARYDFTVLPITSKRDAPFRFAAQLEEGITFFWKDPLGHVAQQTAEFQKALSSNTKLSASVNFESSPANAQTQ